MVTPSRSYRSSRMIATAGHVRAGNDPNGRGYLPLFRLQLIALALLVVGLGIAIRPVSAQTPPHRFFSPPFESKLDGQLLLDGTTVTAWDIDENPVASTVVLAGVWVLRITPTPGLRVAFSFERSELSEFFDVRSDAFTSLDLSLDPVSPPTGSGANTFSPASDPTVRRVHAAALTLDDGRVWIVGGSQSIQLQPTGKTEFFIPEEDEFQSGPTLSSPHLRHTLSPLSDGRVAVIGGWGQVAGAGGLEATDVVDLFDPTTNEATKAGQLMHPRARHASAVLPGDQVFVAGGWDEDDFIAAVEVWDPSTGRSEEIGTILEPRRSHFAIPLAGGRVLIGGGAGRNGNPLATTEIFDLTTNTSSPGPSMNEARLLFSITQLNDGRYLISGGIGESLLLSSMEIYDPVRNEFVEAGEMLFWRFEHSSVTLLDGRVLILGGNFGGDDPTTISLVEAYDPRMGRTETFSSTVSARKWHATARLQDGRVLVTGGAEANRFFGAAIGLFFNNTSELFLPELPNRPTGVTAEPSGQNIQVAWNPPVNNGGSPVTSYTVTAAPPDAIVTTDGNTTSVEVEGLERGTSYTFTVTAENIVGASPPSVPSNAVEIVADIALPVVPGFNLLGWMGATSVEDALATISVDVEAVFAFDAQSKQFRSHSTSGPVVLNDLNDLVAGMGLWVLANGRGTWVQPTIASPLAIDLAAGFNLVVWTGEDGTPVENGVTSLGEDLELLAMWDAENQKFLTYSPTAPIFLNDAESLRQGHGVWVSVRRPAVWDHQTSPNSGGGTPPPPNGDVQPSVPVATTVSEAEAAIVLISTPDGSGSGFVVSDNRIITNQHVVPGSPFVTVTFKGGIERSGTVVASDASLDVAVVEFSDPPDGLRRLDWETAITPTAGTDVWAWGFPFGLFAGTDTAATVSSGVVSAIQTDNDLSFIQTDAAINPGNSGGPLIDRNALVVGINSFILVAGGQDVEGLNFAIDVAAHRSTIRELVNR